MLDKLSGFLPWVAEIWPWSPSGPRIEVDPGWRRAPTPPPSGPIPYWRAFDVEIVAGRDRELLLTEGKLLIEAPEDLSRARAPLKEFLPLPIEVPAGRAWMGKIDGASIADLVEEQMAPSPEDTFLLRIQTWGHHGGRLKTNPLPASTRFLREKQVRDRQAGPPPV